MTKTMKTTPTKTAVKNALQIQAIDGEKLSPEHNRFNKLLKQTETLTKKLETMQKMTDQHRLRVAERIQPLQTDLERYAREVALFLDARLAQVPKKSLTPTQIKTAKALLCAIIGSLAVQGDDAMRSLYDKHNPQTLDNEIHSMQSDMRQEVQSVVAEMLGESLPESIVQIKDFDAFMEATQAQIAQFHQEKSQRKTRNKTRPSAQSREKLTPPTEDADTALRTIYRQLASALHPDRASTEEERVQKTALMKEVNTAYEQRNLLGLLQLQMQVDSVDTKKITEMASEKLAGFTQLLKERVTVLQEALHQMELNFQIELDLPTYLPLCDTTLIFYLGEKVQNLQSQIMELKDILETVKNDDKSLKLWLNAEKRKLNHH